jgi:hypothetical protein
MAGLPTGTLGPQLSGGVGRFGGTVRATDDVMAEQTRSASSGRRWALEEAMVHLVPAEFTAWCEAVDARKREPTHFPKTSYLDPGRTVAGDKNPGWARAVAVEREALRALLIAFRDALKGAGLAAYGRRGGLDGPRERIPDGGWQTFERVNAPESVIGEVRSRGTHYRAVEVMPDGEAGVSEPLPPPRLRRPGSPDMYDWDAGVQLLIRDSYVHGWPRTRPEIRARLLALMAADGLAVPRKRDTADNVLARDLPLLWEAAGRPAPAPGGEG